MKSKHYYYLPKLLVAASLLLFSIQGAGAQGTGDIINSPVDQQQPTEPSRNKIYESITPLSKDKDLSTIHVPDSSSAPEPSELPNEKYQFQSVQPTKTAEQTMGGEVPSKGHAMSDGGQILPDGKYAWTGADVGGVCAGSTPNPAYGQAPVDVPAQVGDKGNGPMMDKLRAPMNGLPMTNSQFAILSAAAPQAAVDQAMDPKGWRPAMKQIQQTQQAQGADDQATCAENNTSAALSMMTTSLINVANESAATPATTDQPYKTYSQAVWMVQQMYKQCFIPLAILLVLPGAVLTQVKAVVTVGILGGDDEDTVSPFVGIIRALMAIFLIPVTQLMVSYCIDIGNSLTYTVQNVVDVQQIVTWGQEQTYNTLPQNADNFIKNIADSGTPMPTRGKLASASEKSAVFERQSFMTSTLQGIFNTINNLISQGLVILNGFQIVLMCYLLLLGPVAAALFAWPSAAGGSGMFKSTFSNWMDGVVVLALWKFWWCVVLLCMAVRIQSGSINATAEFEMYIYTAFMTILLFVPFQPFDFKPGEMVSALLEKCAAGGAGGASGGSGCGGGSSSGGQSGSSSSSSGSHGGSEAPSGPSGSEVTSHLDSSHSDNSNSTASSGSSQGSSEGNSEPAPAPPTAAAFGSNQSGSAKQPGHLTPEDISHPPRSEQVCAQGDQKNLRLAVKDFAMPPMTGERPAA